MEAPRPRPSAHTSLPSQRAQSAPSILLEPEEGYPASGNGLRKIQLQILRVTSHGQQKRDKSIVWIESCPSTLRREWPLCGSWLASTPPSTMSAAAERAGHFCSSASYNGRDLNPANRYYLVGDPAQHQHMAGPQLHLGRGARSVGCWRRGHRSSRKSLRACWRLVLAARNRVRAPARVCGRFTWWASKSSRVPARSPMPRTPSATESAHTSALMMLWLSL